MVVLSKKVGISYLRLLGGEPLLHPDITKFIKYAKRYFPETLIGIGTNGILLPKMKNKF
jgi:molybdenum cofactor biosynthesis enzyme MoaA